MLRHSGKGPNEVRFTSYEDEVKRKNRLRLLVDTPNRLQAMSVGLGLFLSGQLLLGSLSTLSRMSYSLVLAVAQSASGVAAAQE